MILVTGGSGFLGYELVRQLAGKGGEVRVFDRAGCERFPAGVVFQKGDIRDSAAVSASCKDVETVFHLVGIVPQARVSHEEMRAVNVGGVRNILRGCIENRVPRMVFVSSSEVYGYLEDVPCPETAIPGPIGEYGVNKLAAELLCREAMRDHGLAVSILRPTTILGPWNWDGSFESLFKQLDSNGFLPVPGRGDARWHVVHVEDAAAAVALAGERDEAVGGVFNLASTGPVPSHMELAKAMKEHAGSSVRIVKINKALATGALRALCLFGRSPLEPDQFLVGFSDYILDVSKIQAVLGWESRLDSLGAFKESYDWYESTRAVATQG